MTGLARTARRAALIALSLFLGASPANADAARWQALMDAAAGALARGALADAERDARAALAEAEESQGALLDQSLGLLADVLDSGDQLAAAGAVLDRRLALRTQTKGAFDPALVPCLYTLAGIRVGLEDFAASARALEQVLIIDSALFGARDVAIGDAHVYLAYLYTLDDNLEPAARHYALAVPILSETLGPAHDNVLVVMRDEVAVLKALGRAGEAAAVEAEIAARAAPPP